MSFFDKIKTPFTALPAALRRIRRRKRFIRKRLDETMDWSVETFRYNLESAFKAFLSADECQDAKKCQRLMNDAVDCYLLYKATPHEYFLFDFAHKSSKERELYLTNIDKNNRLDISRMQETVNKALTYQALKPYFKRSAVAVEGPGDREAFLELADRASRLFVKPLYGSLGRSVSILELHGREEAEQAFETLLAEQEKWQVEECIRQADCMAAWNPDAVNTVRIPSFLINHDIHLLRPLFRTGTKGSLSDNGGSGGIVSDIDIATGHLTTDGMDNSGHFYSKHPDTGLTYKGFAVPEWDALKTMAAEIHRRLPHFRYLAFDFAYTDAGWVLVEANGKGGLSSTQVLKGPVKAEFLRYIEAT